VDALRERQRVMAPVRREGVRVFDWVQATDAVELLGSLPRVSAKRALLPPSEVLFYFRTGRERHATAAPPPPEPQVLLGVTPCDLQGVRVLDAVFSAEPYPDGLYQARRRATTIGGLGDPSGPESPLHVAARLGISAMDAEGSDFFLTPLPDGAFVLELLTDKAGALESAFRPLPDASAAQAGRVAQWRREARQRVRNDWTTETFRTRVWTTYNARFWDAIGERCIGCGTCTYLCPTCHCFDIQEEFRGPCGARIRHWDTCQFELFTRHASGHNPRPVQSPRARQRVMHKFHYGPVNYGLPFCVGCGRCTQYCPVGIDLREILAAIEAAGPEETAGPREA
jgi:ferredoxin